MKPSRRTFLKHSGCALSAAALLSSFRSLAATQSFAAASAVGGGYRALVCVFLYGGNDGNNMVIPYDNYAAYSAVRGTTAQLNIPQSDLLPIKAASQGSQLFGLHPDMPELQRLYQNKKLAVLCNVGTLVQPLTRQQYLQGAPRPDQLFSHSDQQMQWQTGVTSANQPLSLSGWGGRTADDLAPLYTSGALPMVITTSGNSPFTLGRSTQPFKPGATLAGFPNPPESDLRYNALRQILSKTQAKTLPDAVNQEVISAIGYSDALNAALNPPPTLDTVFPKTRLGDQLLEVARIIAVRSKLNMQRQIFFVSMNGFDTHTNQLNSQGSPERGAGDLLLQLSQALAAFYNATVELGVADQVTSFTLSDFGRTFHPTTGGGSDHAWGSHHFILGDGVKGGDFYGKFPTLELSGPDDAGGEGRWIPTVSVDQYAATLVTWLGLDQSKVPVIFPNITNFSSPDLGFM
ncbi:MAG: DUF1501 domain-containing protein [Methylococcaceae bacterium]|nr:DUF1501 domain-containing protein [Methylococcaceae bacterium]